MLPKVSVDVVLMHYFQNTLILGTVCQMLELMLSLLIYIKSRLDNFWMFKDVKYDYTADLTRTVDRSEYDIESYRKVVEVFQE